MIAVAAAIWASVTVAGPIWLVAVAGPIWVVAVAEINCSGLDIGAANCAASVGVPSGVCFGVVGEVGSDCSWLPSLP